MESVIRYGYYWPSASVLGPGNRFCLWVQGCHRRCYRCTSPDLQPLDGGNEISVAELSKIVIGTEGISGITISGGEPMLQAGELTELLSLVRRSRPELDVIVFTGFTKDEIVSEKAMGMLDYVDLLVDGEYVDELNDGVGLRGSSNQEFHFLTDRLLPYREEILSGSRKREIHLLKENEILTIGIANRRSI